MTPLNRVRATALVIAMVLLFAACDGNHPRRGGDSDAGEPGDWQASTRPVNADDLVWAKGSTLHLGDGSSVDVHDRISTYVVAGDGAYFLPADNTEVRLATAAGVSQTGVRTMDDLSIKVSPSGRYLALLAAGDPDGYGTPQAIAVVVDLQAGTEVVRSTEGLGDRDSDDLAVIYENYETGLLGLTDDTAYYDVVGGVRSYDLSTGDGETRDESAFGAPKPWDLPSTTEWNAPHTWRIQNTPGRHRDTLVTATGRQVVPQTGTSRWALRSWINDDTVVGFAIDDPLIPGLEPDEPEGLSSTLMTCRVPSGECVPIPQATGEVLLPGETS